MYGLVNKAIQDMVCTHFSEEVWEQIKQKAELEIEAFISMEGYPDDVTHRLVKASSQVLGLSPKEVMEAFGEFWVQYTATEGYGEMMDMAGDNLPEFLENLDELHARVGVLFPKLNPPSFECSEMDEDSMNLHYYSHREGLAPMVVGLVQGLGKRFDTEVEVRQTKSRAEGADGDEFSIKYKL